MFAIEPTLTKELILNRFSEEQIFQYYGVPVQKGLFCNPFRQDRNPTCSMFRNKQGTLILKDHAGFFYGSCFDLVKQLFHLSYSEALRKIGRDLRITGSGESLEALPIVEKIDEVKELVTLGASFKDWTEESLKWWSDRGVTRPTLDRYNVYNIDTLFVNSIARKFATKKEPIYGYFFGEENGRELWKFYMPTKSVRFMGNSQAIQGFNQLKFKKQMLVITKSMKDVMALSEYGIEAVAVQCETIVLDEATMDFFKSKYKYIVVNFDHDRTGLMGMQKYKKKYGVLCLTFKDKEKYAKDFSDLILKHGKEKVDLLIKKLKLKVTQLLKANCKVWR